MEKLILVVDDEAPIVDILKFNLTKSGYRVIEAYDGEAGYNLAISEKPDLILLDVMLPKMDGFEVCRRIRATNKQMGIIMLTARTQEADKIAGLSGGADDYVTKPFDTKEVLARIKSVLRRTGNDFEKDEPADQVEEVEFEGLYVSLTNYKLRVKGVDVDAPPKEIELLYHLASHPNRVFTRDQLLDEIWGFKYFGDSRTVDVHVKRLREKLEGVSDGWSLKTVWGVGYKFEVTGE